MDKYLSQSGRIKEEGYIIVWCKNIEIPLVLWESFINLDLLSSKRKENTFLLPLREDFYKIWANW